MMVEIMPFAPETHLEAMRSLYTEYGTWLNEKLQSDYGFGFDVPTAVEEDMRTLGKFMPPKGHLLLASVNGEVAGTASLRAVTPTLCEVKRLFVRATSRGQGVGRTLVQALLDAARADGFTTVQLDSARFMQDAHALYRSFGFTDIPPYAESEVPAEFHANWVFMGRALS